MDASFELHIDAGSFESLKFAGFLDDDGFILLLTIVNFGLLTISRQHVHYNIAGGANNGSTLPLSHVIKFFELIFGKHHHRLAFILKFFFLCRR